SERNREEVLEQAQAWANALDASDPANALPILEVLWLHQQFSKPNRDLLVKVLQSPEERARIAGQRVAWHWSDRPTHQVASADSTISGMQFRTYYESWWGTTTGSNQEDVESSETESIVSQGQNVETTLPSERIVLYNK